MSKKYNNVDIAMLIVFGNTLIAFATLGVHKYVSATGYMGWFLAFAFVWFIIYAILSLIRIIMGGK